ncbi:hypothetical protein R3P38DRAFT_2794053 [Favolaschia claudopus]|uniref:Uncharacterized protein n=1 Tax=Favolaschia claudopus TaxID=2862362 RepID=A0AAW0ABW1_9AGAR
MPSLPVETRDSLVPLDSVLGSLLIGLVLSSILFGATCQQVYLYFTNHCSRDSVYLKTLVLVLLALDAFHVALISHTMYHMSVTNFGDYAQFGRYPPWSLKLQIPVGGISASMVQFFYAYRIYMLSQKSLVFPVPIFVFALGAFGNL